MSKSAGNGIDPMEVIRKYGADALRFTMVSAVPIGTDISLDNKDLETAFAPGRNFANKLWNAARFALTNLPDVPPRLAELDPAQFELADRWILSRCQRTIETATDGLARFRVSDAASAIYQFVWHDLADWYLEQVKPRLYGTLPGGDTARSILADALETSLRLLHPFMPFITEELWQNLPRGETAGENTLLATAEWPKPDLTLIDAEAEDRFTRVQALVTAIRTIRAEYGVEPGRAVRAVVEPASTAALEAFNAEQRTIERLAKLSKLLLQSGHDGVGAHQVLPDGSTVFIPLGDAIDVAKECARLGGEVQRLEKQLQALIARLGNEQFVSRAPAAVVEGERAKEKSWRDQLAALGAKLKVLGC